MLKMYYNNYILVKNAVFLLLCATPAYGTQSEADSVKEPYILNKLGYASRKCKY